MYAQQNGRQFETNNEEMMAFLGMNYIMGINRLPSVKDYWQVDEYIGNEDIRKCNATVTFHGFALKTKFFKQIFEEKRLTYFWVIPRLYTHGRI